MSAEGVRNDHQATRAAAGRGVVVWFGTPINFIMLFVKSLQAARSRSRCLQVDECAQRLCDRVEARSATLAVVLFGSGMFGSEIFVNFGCLVQDACLVRDVWFWTPINFIVLFVKSLQCLVLDTHKFHCAMFGSGHCAMFGSGHP